MNDNEATSHVVDAPRERFFAQRSSTAAHARFARVPGNFVRPPRRTEADADWVVVGPQEILVAVSKAGSSLCRETHTVILNQ